MSLTGYKQRYLFPTSKSQNDVAVLILHLLK